MNFKQLGKPDPEHLVASKKKATTLLELFTKLSDEPKEDFLTSQLPSVMAEYFQDSELEEIRDWSL